MTEVISEAEACHLYYFAVMAKALEDVFSEAKRGDINAVAIALMRMKGPPELGDGYVLDFSETLQALDCAIRLVQAVANQQLTKV